MEANSEARTGIGPKWASEHPAWWEAATRNNQAPRVQCHVTSLIDRDVRKIPTSIVARRSFCRLPVGGNTVTRHTRHIWIVCIQLMLLPCRRLACDDGCAGFRDARMPRTPPGQAHHCQRTQTAEAEALFSSSAHQHRYRSKTGLADGPGEVGRRDGEAGRAEVGRLPPAFWQFHHNCRSRETGAGER